MNGMQNESMIKTTLSKQMSSENIQGRYSFKPVSMTSWKLRTDATLILTDVVFQKRWLIYDLTAQHRSVRKQSSSDGITFLVSRPGWCLRLWSFQGLYFACRSKAIFSFIYIGVWTLSLLQRHHPLVLHWLRSSWCISCILFHPSFWPSIVQTAPMPVTKKWLSIVY